MNDGNHLYDADGRHWKEVTKTAVVHTEVFENRTSHTNIAESNVASTNQRNSSEAQSDPIGRS